MGNPVYVNLARQTGLLKEMRTVANNIANLGTTGYRREGVTFAEFIARAGPGAPSLSIATARARWFDSSQGALRPTGGELDFAIEGDGYFLVDTPQGQRLTRAGAFSLNAAGEIVTPDGYRLLDEGGAPIPVPPDAGRLSLAPDGTLSAGDVPIARVAVVEPAGGVAPTREAGVLLRPVGPLQPVAEPDIRQGFVEASNVNPVLELSRMIEVQRAYELGRSFLDREDERLRSAVRVLGGG